MTSAATRQLSPEIGSEQSLHLHVCVARIAERDELFRVVAPIHVEGEWTAVFAAHVTRQTLLLSPVIVPGRAVEFNELLDVGYKRYQAIAIKVVGTRRLESEVYG